jgi:hypothetical protein
MSHFYPYLLNAENGRHVTFLRLWKFDHYVGNVMSSLIWPCMTLTSMVKCLNLFVFCWFLLVAITLLFLNGLSTDLNIIIFNLKRRTLTFTHKWPSLWRSNCWNLKKNCCYSLFVCFNWMDCLQIITEHSFG